LPDWALLAAGGIFQDTTSTRDAIITKVHDFLSWKTTDQANPSMCCWRSTAQPFRGAASAAMGAAFAFHALR